VSWPELGHSEDVWEQVRPVWTAEPETVLARYLLLKAWLAKVSGPDAELYRQDGQRKLLELLSRLGRGEDGAFLRWTAWWETGRVGNPPELGDSPFTSPCANLVWGETGRLEALSRIRSEHEPRFQMLARWAAEELAKPLIVKQQWSRLLPLARQHGLAAEATLAEARTSGDERALQYRRYRMERLVRQSAQLGLPPLARWRSP
jgi:hypothetical protein